MTTQLNLRGPFDATCPPAAQHDERQTFHHQAHVRLWVAGRMAAANLVGSVTSGAAATTGAVASPLEGRTATPQMRPEDELVFVPVSHSGGTTTGSDLSTAAAVSRLHDESGLTWDQLGRLLGVSRRAVHMWAAGKRMNSKNTELLGKLLRLVDSAPTTGPEQCRLWLFTPGGDGTTPIERFLDDHRRPGPPLSGSGYTPAGLLGISHE
ncbi:hypothetical protein GCM10010346_63420 [Streptomyces chryseus]|uniref:HTH cro/C1-type domain-containing protein n=1 Tax=Streptomyces chryseus TaxID=68186 RepID=A0ABQ3EA98_9ACTN|nr:hypothetical protein GCM10010346_63420 [Streptomyces chryseus]